MINTTEGNLFLVAEQNCSRETDRRTKEPIVVLHAYEQFEYTPYFILNERNEKVLNEKKTVIKRRYDGKVKITATELIGNLDYDGSVLKTAGGVAVKEIKVRGKYDYRWNFAQKKFTRIATLANKQHAFAVVALAGEPEQIDWD